MEATFRVSPPFLLEVLRLPRNTKLIDVKFENIFGHDYIIVTVDHPQIETDEVSPYYRRGECNFCEQTYFVDWRWIQHVEPDEEEET